MLGLGFRFLGFVFRVWDFMVKGMMFCVLGFRV